MMIAITNLIMIGVIQTEVQVRLIRIVQTVIQIHSHVPMLYICGNRIRIDLI